MTRNEIDIRRTEADALPSPPILLPFGGFRRALETRNDIAIAALKTKGHLFVGGLVMAAACALDEERHRPMGDDLDPRNLLRDQLLAQIEVATVNAMVRVQSSMFDGWW